MQQLNELRIKIDQLNERIVSRLKDRSRFPLNQTVYRPGGVALAGASGLSFLEFAIQGLERYHATLGRFEYPDQFPLFAEPEIASQAVRAVRQPGLPSVAIDIKEELLGFYRGILDRLCLREEDPDCFGETVYVDADLLQLINERINIGRFVAQAKLTDEPDLREILSDPATLEDRLRVPARELSLLESVRQTARRFELDPDLAEDVFRWIMRKTLAIEVLYLQRTTAERRTTNDGH